MTQIPIIGEIPQKSHHNDAGFDLRANIVSPIWLHSGVTMIVSLGIKAQIPDGFFGLVCPRSGLVTKHKISIINSPGVIDAGFRGEWRAGLHNHGRDPYLLNPGERVAQVVFISLPNIELIAATTLEDSERGEGGFGSTGKIEHRTLKDSETGPSGAKAIPPDDE